MTPIQEIQYLRGSDYPPSEKYPKYIELIKLDTRCIRYVPIEQITSEMITLVLSKVPAYHIGRSIFFVPWELDFFFNLPDSLYYKYVAQITTLLLIKGYDNVITNHPLYISRQKRIK